MTGSKGSMLGMSLIMIAFVLFLGVMLLGLFNIVISSSPLLKNMAIGAGVIAFIGLLFLFLGVG